MLFLNDSCKNLCKIKFQPLKVVLALKNEWVKIISKLLITIYIYIYIIYINILYKYIINILDIYFYNLQCMEIHCIKSNVKQGPNMYKSIKRFCMEAYSGLSKS